MSSPFLTGLSGLTSAKISIGVTANNIANTETPGFKSSYSRFGDIFAGSQKAGGFKMDTGASSVGGGVNLQSISQKFSQGTIARTDNELDLAINGQGFFQVQEYDGTISYTRVGSFEIDRDGYMITPKGQKLTAFQADANGDITSFTNVVKFSRDNALPNATTSVKISANLDAGEDEPIVFPFDIENPQTYNFATSLTSYDSLGNPHLNSVYFKKTAVDNQWEAYHFVDGEELVPAGGVAGDPVIINFTQDGQLADANGSIFGVVNFEPKALTSGAFDLDLTYDYASLSQYGNPFNVNEVDQDGFATGNMAGIDINDEGIISIRFNNGESKILGQLALANFNNPRGLRQLGDAVYAATSESGVPIVGVPATGDFGAIESAGLEGSNVELAEELVGLITAQRSYQANAQVISTWDELLQEAIQLGR